MNIIWHGLGCFTLKKKGVTGEAAVVIDPYDNSLGLRLPRTLKASMVVQSHDAKMANNTKAVSGMLEGNDPFVVRHAGEYEVQGIFVTGIHAPLKDQSAHTIYRINIAGIKIAHLGALDRPLKESEVGALGEIDILILPVGGKSVLDKDKAQDIVQQIEPRLIIPSHFKLTGLKESFEDVEGFCKDMACSRDSENKLNISKSKLPQEDMRIVVLSKS